MAAVEVGNSTTAEIEMAAIEEPIAKEPVPEGEASVPSQDGPEPLSDVVAAKPTSDVVTEASQVSRDHWTYNWEFIFAAVAFTVDAPVIFRFMYSSYRNGGASFMIMYAVFLLLIGVPLFFMELCLGQFFGKGPVHIWHFCPVFRGIGVAMVITIAFITPYYNTVISWIFFYFFQSFSPTLPWANCDNSWNTESCQVSTPMYTNYSYPRSSPAAEYFERRVLKLHESMGIEHLGSLQWELVGCTFAVTILVFVVLFWGVKVIGKVLFVGLLLRYIGTFMLLLRAMTLPGSATGVRYYIYPSFEYLLNVQSWMDAFMVALFTTGVGTGCIHTLASYKKFKSTALRDSFLVCLISSGTCFLTGLTFHAFYGALAHLEGTQVYSTGLLPMVEIIPELFAKIPLFQYWSALFFFVLLIAVISAQLVAIEVIITAIADILPVRTKLLRPLITAVVCCAFFIFSFPFLTKGGYFLFRLFDQHVYLMVFHIIIIMQCVTVGWIYGIDQFSNDIHMMTGMRPSIIYKFMWCFIIPFLSLLAFGFQFVNYYPPTVKSYVYPTWAVVIGWVISLVPLVPLPVFFLLTIATPGLRTVTSNTSWGPADSDYKTIYSSQIQRPRTLLDRLAAVFKI